MRSKTANIANQNGRTSATLQARPRNTRCPTARRSAERVAAVGRCGWSCARAFTRTSSAPAVSSAWARWPIARLMAIAARKHRCWPRRESSLRRRSNPQTAAKDHGRLCPERQGEEERHRHEDVAASVPGGGPEPDAPSSAFSGGRRSRGGAGGPPHQPLLRQELKSRLRRIGCSVGFPVPPPGGGAPTFRQAHVGHIARATCCVHSPSVSRSPSPSSW
jgi:hypothetical protein